ncbi:MAG: aldo/keto reductase, partial [Candidatus Micrarchaeota archaeon]|nr:aldo/keto reductase [Candidatus Micrarchaeota archaeon]
MPLDSMALPNGSMPKVGLGTWRLNGASCVSAVASALKMGYRHIDTAAFYQNEAENAQGIQKSGVAREDLFLTTKLWPTHSSAKQAVAECRASLKRLGTDFVDLYLVHYYPEACS